MKLDSNDLQFERVRNFDGTFAYAQNKASHQCQHPRNNIYHILAAASCDDQEMGREASWNLFCINAPRCF